MRIRRYKKIASFIVFLVFPAQILLASPSGLNNIPTTDVTPDKTLVLQGWFTAGDEAKPSYNTGFKYGIFDKVEVGLDSKVGSGKAAPVAVQAKLKAIELDFGFSGLVGIEGITFNKDIDKNIVPYLVVSQKLKMSQDIDLFRVNVGYGFQKDNFGIFVGVDRAFAVWEQELVLRSDLKQVNDGDDLLVSAGFLLTLPFNLALESWLSIPTESGAEEGVTVKLNYIAKF